RPLPVVVNIEGDNTQLANLCGPLDENLKQLADGMGVQLTRRGSRIVVDGENAELAAGALRRFADQAVHKALTVDDVQLGLVELNAIRASQPAQEGAFDPAELPPLDDESGTI